jgi:hypothetical protein
VAPPARAHAAKGALQGAWVDVTWVWLLRQARAWRAGLRRWSGPPGRAVTRARVRHAHGGLFRAGWLALPAGPPSLGSRAAPDDPPPPRLERSHLGRTLERRATPSLASLAACDEPAPTARGGRCACGSLHYKCPEPWDADLPACSFSFY